MCTKKLYSSEYNCFLFLSEGERRKSRRHSAIKSQGSAPELRSFANRPSISDRTNKLNAASNKSLDSLSDVDPKERRRQLRK